MKSGSQDKEEDASGGQPAGNGKPRRHPDWRRREQAATTTVYVVHPTQFRTVVQQLTGAASPPPLPTHQHQHVGGGGNGAGTRIRTNAVAQNSGGGGEQNGGRGRTLGQMHQDCLDWANAADDC